MTNGRRIRQRFNKRQTSRGLVPIASLRGQQPVKNLIVEFLGIPCGVKLTRVRAVAPLLESIETELSVLHDYDHDDEHSDY